VEFAADPNNPELVNEFAASFAPQAQKAPDEQRENRRA
jgi:hypothetical protein